MNHEMSGIGVRYKKEILNKVDQIVVLKEGVVIDNGTYDELAGKNDELNIMIKKEASALCVGRIIEVHRVT